MSVTEIPMKVLRLQYQLARLPLQVIEDQLITRLDPEAPARLRYERSLGRLDAAVGAALGDADLQQRGTALLDRSAALERAAQLDAAATAQLEHADTALAQTRAETAQQRTAARATKEQRVRDARETAEQRKQSATATAQQRAGTVKKQADATAAQRKKTVAAAKQQEQAKVRATEQKATAAAAAKHKTAAATHTDAARRQARADRVEELADAEKRSRRADDA